MRQRIRRAVFADIVRQLIPRKLHRAALLVKVAIAVIRIKHRQSVCVDRVVVARHRQKLAVFHVVAQLRQHVVLNDRFHRIKRRVRVAKQLFQADSFARRPVEHQRAHRASRCAVCLRAVPAQNQRNDVPRRINLAALRQFRARALGQLRCLRLLKARFNQPVRHQQSRIRRRIGRRRVFLRLRFFCRKHSQALPVFLFLLHVYFKLCQRPCRNGKTQHHQNQR